MRPSMNVLMNNLPFILYRHCLSVNKPPEINGNSRETRPKPDLFQFKFNSLDGYAIYHAFCFLLTNNSTRKRVVRDLHALWPGCAGGAQARRVAAEAERPEGDAHFEHSWQ